MVARVQFNVRMPADLHEQIRALAAQEVRSLNGQIEVALRQWLAWRGPRNEQRLWAATSDGAAKEAVA